MADSPRLGLTYLTASQSQKHATVNDAIRELDGLVQMSVEDRHLTAPPASPSEGDLYIIGGNPSGGWSAFSADDVVIYSDSAWYAFTPSEGWMSYVKDEDLVVVFNGTSWIRWQQKAATFKAERTTNFALTGSWAVIDAWDTEVFSDPDTFTLDETNGSLTLAHSGKYMVGANVLVKHATAGTAECIPSIRLMADTGLGFSAVLGFRSGSYSQSDTLDEVGFNSVMLVDATADDTVLALQARAFGSLAGDPEFQHVVWWAYRVA